MLKRKGNGFDLEKKSLLLLSLLLLTISISVLPASKGDIWDPFHSKQEKITMWKTLWDKYPDTEYVSIGKTYSGEDIWMFEAGNPRGGRVLWDGELHGNEDKGGEILYLIAQWLLESDSPKAQQILEQNHLLFVPVVNTNTERGNSNREISPYGVDLNRNFQTGWHQSNPQDDTYSGPSPLSEPETRILRKVFSEYKPIFYVNLHCGAGPYSFYYSGSKANITITNQAITKTKAICNEMGIVPYPIRRIGSSGFAIGDAVELGVESAWLIETVGVDTAWRHLPEHYEELVNEYFPKCLAIFQAMCETCAIESNQINTIEKQVYPSKLFTIPVSFGENQVQIYANSTLIYEKTITITNYSTSYDVQISEANMQIGTYEITAKINGKTVNIGFCGVTYFSDLNHDYTVDFNDIITLVGAYIEYHANNHVNSLVDFNQDQKIDFDDIAIFVSGYNNYHLCI